MSIALATILFLCLIFFSTSILDNIVYYIVLTIFIFNFLTFFLGFAQRGRLDYHPPKNVIPQHAQRQRPARGGKLLLLWVHISGRKPKKPSIFTAV